MPAEGGSSLGNHSPCGGGYQVKLKGDANLENAFDEVNGYVYEMGGGEIHSLPRHPAGIELDRSHRVHLGHGVKLYIPDRLAGLVGSLDGSRVHPVETGR